MPIFCTSPPKSPQTKLEIRRPVEKVRPFEVCFAPNSTDLKLKSVLVAADDVLRSAAESGCGDERSEKLDGKFAAVINLLVSFEKDFLSETSDPNIGGITRKANMSDASQSPSTILQALKQDLHSKVKLPSVSLFLEADDQ